MQSTTENLASKKRANASPASSSKAAIKDLVKPIDSTPAKDNSLERLLASCCDCV